MSERERIELLPCDITVGHITFRKGVKLETFVNAARRWFELATLSPPQAGWRLVPIEPSDTMNEAAKPFRKGVGGTAERIYRAMIAAAPQPQPYTRAGWRGIESAPRDGQSILLICADAYSPEADIGWFHSDGWHHYSRPDEKWHGGVGKWFPTHWQPLPLPPEGGKGDEGAYATGPGGAGADAPGASDSSCQSEGGQQ